MLTYPKSTMRVQRMPVHLSSGHVTLVPRKFYPPHNFPQSDLGRQADSRWALPQISSLISKPHDVRTSALVVTSEASPLQALARSSPGVLHWTGTLVCSGHWTDGWPHTYQHMAWHVCCRCFVTLLLSTVATKVGLLFSASLLSFLFVCFSVTVITRESHLA